MGLLIACRTMELGLDVVPIGTRLVVEAERTWGDRDLGHFECCVTRVAAGEVMARAALSVAMERDRVEPH